MEFKITTLDQLNENSKKTAIAALQNIFYETSTKKTFQSEQEKKNFEYGYLGVYLKEPQFVCLAIDEQDQIHGYCLGTPKTSPEHISLHPYLSLFEKEIQLYPAHLHINCLMTAQGKGLGSKLIRSFEMLMEKNGAQGLHLITGANERNVSFYLKNHYQTIATRPFKNSALTLLAKAL